MAEYILTDTDFFVVLKNGLDHGNLAGLADDDHTQYLLVDCSRALGVGATDGWASYGLTINQGPGNTDIGLSLKSGIVAHGCTGWGETDTYFFIWPDDINYGGAGLYGFCDGQAPGIAMNALTATPPSNTFATTSYGIITLNAYKISGTQVGDPGANDILLSIRTYKSPSYTSVWLLDEDGDVWQSGNLFINESANAKMTMGITINQGANDDEILAFKSPDVAHGVTDWSETDTYGLFRKVDPDAGGLQMVGLKDAVGTYPPCMSLIGVATWDVDTTKTTAGRGIVEIQGKQASGTSEADVVASGNILVVRARISGAMSTVMSVDKDSYIHLTGASGGLYINDTRDAGYQGIYAIKINQGGEDGPLMTFLSSDVNHGGTTYLETDAYADFSKSQTTGGLRLRTIQGTGYAYQALKLGPNLLVDDANTTKSSAGRAVVEVIVGKLSGANPTTFTANGNAFAVCKHQTGFAETTMFIVDGSGNLWAGGTLQLNSVTDAYTSAHGIVLDLAGDDDLSVIQMRDSTDVIHGMTSWTSTNTWGAIRKALAAGGGIKIEGYTDGGANYPVYIQAFSGAAINAVKTTNAIGAVNIVVGEISGTGISATITADANLFTIRKAVSGPTYTTVFAVDEDGDIQCGRDITFMSGTDTTRIWRDVNTAGFNFVAGTNGNYACSIQFYGRDNGSYAGKMWITCGGYNDLGWIRFRHVNTAASYVTLGGFNPGGIFFIGATEAQTNAKMTKGLTINQGTADDEAISLKSSDVAHGFTANTETDTYFNITKISGDYGGCQLRAYAEDNASATGSLSLLGYGATPDTAKGLANGSLITIWAGELSGGAIANVTADGNIFGVGARRGGAWERVMILDEDGDLWLAGHLTVGGATVSATTGIKVYETDHINATNYGVQCSVVSAHTSSGTYYNVGGGFISTQTQGAGIDNDGYARGLYVESMLQGAGDLATLAAEAITYGLYTGGTGTIDNAYGLLINPYSFAAGTITSMYSIYITARVDNGATVTSEWAIYSDHDAPSRILDSLTINQGANDTLIMQFQSSDVAHGITDYVVTSTYAEFLKASSTLGGLGIRAYTEDNLALSITAMYTVENTTKTSAGTAPTMMGAWIKSGTGVTTPGANANIFIVRSGSSAKFIVDAEGDYFYDGTGSAFDEYDDAQLVRALTLSTSKNFIRSKFDEHIKYNEDSLVEAGILGAPTSEGGLINGAQLQRLHNGAIWQLYERLEYQEKMIEDLQAKLKLLEV